MEIKPIKTEADYETTLSEIEKLWDSEPDTPESDRLDILVTLVEAYETKHYPIDPPDPVDAIKFRMEQMGLTDKDLGQYMGGRGRVTKKLLRKVWSGRLDLNQRPPEPHSGTLPGCATPRVVKHILQ